MISTLRQIRRKYRRYRHANQYDSPIKILLFDLGISLSKIMLFAAFAMALWFALIRLTS